MRAGCWGCGGTGSGDARPAFTAALLKATVGDFLSEERQIVPEGLAHGLD